MYILCKFHVIARIGSLSPTNGNIQSRHEEIAASTRRQAAGDSAMTLQRLCHNTDGIPQTIQAFIDFFLFEMINGGSMRMVCALVSVPATNTPRLNNSAATL